MLRKEHIVNSCMGFGMANGETCVRFENDSRNKKWSTKDGGRHDKASNLVRHVAAILAIPDSEKRPGQALGEEVTTTHYAYHEKRQGVYYLFKPHIQCLSCYLSHGRFPGVEAEHVLS